MENHDMWKKVIDEETQKQGQGAESVHLNNVAEPILAIHEEEEEPGSREELLEGEDPEEEVEEAEWPVSPLEESEPPEELQEEEEPQWKKPMGKKASVRARTWKKYFFVSYPINWLLFLPAHHLDTTL